MSKAVSEELIQKISQRSYDPNIGDDKTGGYIVSQILSAIEVVGGSKLRLDKKPFDEFDLFEDESFLEELALSICYDSLLGVDPDSRKRDYSFLKSDSCLLEIADLVKSELHQLLKEKGNVNYFWGYIKASDQGGVIVSPKI